jgi:pimeloyl-ACP methyl ester carboxylesterase
MSEDPPSGRVVEPESLVVTVDTGDSIHFLDWGGASASLPPLVLVHGFAATGWVWAPVARRLREHTQVVTVDLRGHGLSDAPREGYDLTSLAYDVMTVATATSAGSDAAGVVVAGHGLGAQVAAIAASIEPGAVHGLALVDGGWEDLNEATGLSPAEFLRGLDEPPEVLRSMGAYLEDRRGYDPESWDADQERAARAAVDEKHAGHVAPVTRAHVRRAVVDAMFEYRPREALAAVDVPLLVCVAEAGGSDDESVRERRIALDDVQRARAARGLGPARVVTFAGVGHNLMRYRPNGVADALLDLLEATATSGGTPGDPR